MKMAQLTEFGMSQWFIDRWIQTVGDELLDWQADAIRHFDLFGRQPVNGKRNLLVIAPTSSGKTFLAELAMADALMRRRKVVYVAPLKALTMQKYDHLHTVFAPLGFRVVVSTRDRRSADGALRRSRSTKNGRTFFSPISICWQRSI
jgi:helicase